MDKLETFGHKAEKFRHGNIHASLMVTMCKEIGNMLA